MKKRSKILIMLAISTCLIALVGANLNTYFGTIDTEMTVEQSVTIDNNSFDKPLCHSVTINSGDFVEYRHTIYNRAKTCNVSINQTTTGLTTGLTLQIKYMNNTEVKFPILLSHGQNVELQFRYKTDINLKPKKYKIKIFFNVVEE